MSSLYRCANRGTTSWLVAGLCLSIWLCGGIAWGQPNPADINCSPANLMLVVDTSGSMKTGGKLDGLKQAASQIVNLFKNKLRMGLIRFSGGKTELLVPLGPPHGANPDVDGHANKLLAALQALQPDGDTPLTAALELAMNTYLQVLPNDPLHQDPDPKTQRRSFVLIVTDGEPTDATTTYNPLMFIKQLRKLKVGTKVYDILTFVVGLGSAQDIRTFELSQYAIAGGTQNFLHALVPADLAPFFEKVSKTASTEVCNGRDDDCSGTIDEDLERDCKNNCGTGKEKCHKGQWSQCTAPPPGEEICDGRDNNCNGEVDEGLSRACSSACGVGTQSCVQGDWSTCTAARPEPEICDGIDNDCDGQVDNGSLCGSGKCVAQGAGKAACEISCTGNECPKGFTCDQASGKCQEDPCHRKKCPAGTTCDDSSGTAVCKDLCATANCPAGKTCGESGTCIDCYEEKCATGMFCMQGKCVVDACLEGGCPKGQGCREGKCFDSCEGIKCPAGERCSKGKCERDLCASKTCGANQVCVSGQCVQDRCHGATAISCGKGRICEPSSGACEDDPCLHTTCPAGVACYRGECGVEPPPKDTTPGACQQNSDCPTVNGIISHCQNNRCQEIDVRGCGSCSAVGGKQNNSIFLLLGFLWLLAIGLRARRSS